MDAQDKRIFQILHDEELEVNSENLATYLAYLKKNISLSCILTGIEDFEWEEFYVFGPGDKKEYEKLKKTKPSHTDKFNLTEFVEEIDDDVGILVNVKRISDNKSFQLPLADLEAADKKSKNYQLLDDYSVWFTSY